MSKIARSQNVPISFENVTKQYQRVTAVKSVSFQVKRGQFFALIGPNGAGKSTIVKMLMGFVFPTSGEISIFGVSPRDTKRRKIGFLSENHRIAPDLTGYEYLRRHCVLMNRTDCKDEISRVLELTGMKSKAHLKAGTYSKGMVQRTALASAMLFSPQILVLDEPTNGLDPIGIRDFRVIIEGLKEQDVTVLLNSHLLSEVEKTCDTFAIINKGKIVAQGGKSELLQNGETLEESFIRNVEKSN